MESIRSLRSSVELQILSVYREPTEVIMRRVQVLFLIFDNPLVLEFEPSPCVLSKTLASDLTIITFNNKKKLKEQDRLRLSLRIFKNKIAKLADTS